MNIQNRKLRRISNKYFDKANTNTLQQKVSVSKTIGKTLRYSYMLIWITKYLVQVNLEKVSDEGDEIALVRCDFPSLERTKPKAKCSVIPRSNLVVRLVLLELLKF